ncbi:MAG: hypothetical protein WC154_07850 [Candidatus Izemoplasmatales bacterium]
MKKIRVFETAMRISIGADKRKPWNELFFNMDMQPWRMLFLVKV